MKRVLLAASLAVAWPLAFASFASAQSTQCPGGATTTTTAAGATTTTTAAGGTTTTTAGGVTTTTTAGGNGTTTTSAPPGSAETTTTSAPSGSPSAASFANAQLIVVTQSAATATPSNVAAGGQTTVSGGCFAPNRDLTVTLSSDPVLLTVIRSDASGNYRATVTIPANTTAGAHKIITAGPGADGSDHQSVANITVFRGDLAVTGSNSMGPITLGAIAVVLGSLIVGAARQRRLLASRSAGNAQATLDRALRQSDRWHRIR